MDEALKSQPVFSATAPSFGGSSFWVSLPSTVDALQLEKLAAENGIVINAGNNYFANPDAPGNFCRLGFSSIAAEKIPAGIEKLATLAVSLQES